MKADSDQRPDMSSVQSASAQPTQPTALDLLAKDPAKLTLLEKQQLFSLLASRLIQRACALGYSVTLGHAFRCERCVSGSTRSLHKSRLALDLNLFLGSKYLETTEAHAVLGAWWEKQHPLCRWGGHFARADGNHYSLEHEGRA